MRGRFVAVLVVSAVIASGVVVLAVTVAPTSEQKQQVRDADRVGEAYERELGTSMADLSAYVVERRLENKTDYQKLADQVAARMDDVPRIPETGTTSYGREHSREYRTAAGRRALELEPFDEFVTWLETVVVPRQEFVDVGIDLVQINPLKLLEGFNVQFSGSALRTEVVPAYRKVRKRLEQAQPGPAEAELARDLMRYADDTIKMTRRGADDIDAGQAFFFDFGDRPAALLTRLEAAQRSIAVEVTTRVDAFDPSLAP